MKDKTYKDAQLGEFVHSIAVEHAPEHEVICGSKPAGEKHGDTETAAERYPQALGHEVTTSSRG
jgi:hypothetical protein